MTPQIMVVVELAFNFRARLAACTGPPFSIPLVAGTGGYEACDQSHDMTPFVERSTLSRILGELRR